MSASPPAPGRPVRHLPLPCLLPRVLPNTFPGRSRTRWRGQGPKAAVAQGIAPGEPYAGWKKGCPAQRLGRDAPLPHSPPASTFPSPPAGCIQAPAEQLLPLVTPQKARSGQAGRTAPSSPAEPARARGRTVGADEPDLHQNGTGTKVRNRCCFEGTTAAWGFFCLLSIISFCY